MLSNAWPFIFSSEHRKLSPYIPAVCSHDGFPTALNLLGWKNTGMSVSKAFYPACCRPYNAARALQPVHVGLTDSEVSQSPWPPSAQVALRETKCSGRLVGKHQ